MFYDINILHAQAAIWYAINNYQFQDAIFLAERLHTESELYEYCTIMMLSYIQTHFSFVCNATCKKGWVWMQDESGHLASCVGEACVVITCVDVVF